jgi:hypothetical protein
MIYLPAGRLSAGWVFFGGHFSTSANGPTGLVLVYHITNIHIYGQKARVKKIFLDKMQG